VLLVYKNVDKFELGKYVYVTEANSVLKNLPLPQDQHFSSTFSCKQESVSNLGQGKQMVLSDSEAVNKY
jgi:hypothetical protein